ncbi:transporter [Clostridium kluyveri]|uniref:transporter n=1 Tax=Clostridium kluyveri TaxID=1534 RepID=UPI0022451566|nr:transporter [Clostridium kluyveri]UZQ49660.1 transporter [Clostridium kluyveri]
MNKYISLTKVFLKNSSSNFLKDKRGSLSKTIKQLLLYAVIILSLLPLISMFGVATTSSYDILKPLNQEGIILSAAMSISSAVIFTFGIFFIMSVFYFSSDVDTILVLPVKPWIILMSKFTIVLIYEYITEAVVLMPVMVAFGVKSSAGLIYYIYSIIVFSTLPIVPLIIAGLITILIMRFSGFTKNKDRFKTIAQIGILIFVLGINLILQKVGKGFSSGADMARLLAQGNNSLLKSSSKLFINIRYAVESLINSSSLAGISNMLLYLLTTAILLTIFIIFSEAFYIKGVIGMNQIQAKHKVLTSSEITKKSAKKSKVLTYTIKELNILFRTPVYFMNCVIMNFIWPLFFIIPLVSQKNFIKNFTYMHSYFNAIMSNSITLGISISIVFGVSLMLSVINPIGCTAISREGKNIFVNKYIPMDYKNQLLSKALAAFIINFSGIMLIISLITIIIRPPLYIFIIIILLSVIGTIFSIFLGIIIDLNYPKLNWDNEQRAVKQNFNVLISMILGSLITGILIFSTIQLHIPFHIILPLIIIIFSITDIVLYKIITTRGVALYKNIE